MKKPPSFRQADLSRALKAVASAGLTIGRVEIESGCCVLIISQEAPDDLALDAAKLDARLRGDEHGQH